MLELVAIIGTLMLAAVLLVTWPFLRRRSWLAPSPAEPGAALRAELEARYQALAELDDDLATGKLSAGDHARVKAELERGAAVLLARLETLEPRGSEPNRGPARAAARPVPRTGSRRVLLAPGVLAGAAAGFLLLGVGLGVLVGRVLTSPPTSAPSAPPVDRAAELERELGRNPPDVRTLLALGHRALDKGRGAEAARAYRRVLEAEPQNAEALTHVGALLLQSGFVDQALAHLDRALAVDPAYAHALWDKAQILYRAKQDYAGAVKTWEAFLDVIPSGADAERARAMIAEAKGRLLLGEARGPQATAPGALPR